MRTKRIDPPCRNKYCPICPPHQCHQWVFGPEHAKRLQPPMRPRLSKELRKAIQGAHKKGMS